MTIWGIEGPELKIKHVVVTSDKDERFDEKRPKSDMFLWNAPKYGRNVSIIPKNVLFSNNGRYIKIESRRFKHKKDDTNPFDAFNAFNLGQNTFLYMLETLENIETKFRTESDLFLYNEDKSPKSVNPKYNKLAWVVRSWGRTNSYLSFTPHVLADKDSNYPGLKLTSNQGFIGELSWDQFLLFKLTLKELIKNFYQASMELYNMTLNNIILKELTKPHSDK